eukprot:8359392-Alexandrium_andersonii.AAC.1
MSTSLRHLGGARASGFEGTRALGIGFGGHEPPASRELEPSDGPRRNTSLRLRGSRAPVSYTHLRAHETSAHL